MKPDWKDAPEWANYLTLDDQGWYWFEDKPKLYNGSFRTSSGRCVEADVAYKDTLIESRPLDTQ